MGAARYGGAMSYSPSDPFAPSGGDGSPHNPYAPPSGSAPEYGASAQGGAPSAHRSPYGPAAGPVHDATPPPLGGQGVYDQPGGAPYGYPGQGQAPQGGYGSPGMYGAYAPPRPNDGLAVASMVCSLAGMVTCGLSGIVGLILGIVALSRLKRTGAGGRGMAITGIAVGAVFAVWAVLTILSWFVPVFSWMFWDDSSYY